MSKIKWQPYNDVKDNLSDIQKDWLFDTGSLTKRLTFLSQNQFSLQVLSEVIQWLRKDECKILEILPTQKEWVREVVLEGCNQPWVYARSIIIPNFQMHSNQNMLMHIGQKPLGSILFNKNDFEREPIEVAKYPKKLLPCQYCYPHLWARRSCFKNNDYNILVQEIFLPFFWSFS